MFCFTGVPDIWYSDNGPQFASRVFREFLRDWGVEHRTSSPGYPQSNGIAEAAVKTTKRLIRRCWDQRSASIDPDKWTRAILQYRNTPTAGGRSPAQVLFGRPVQDALPAHRRAFAAEWQRAAEITETAAAKRQEKVEGRYNAYAKDLPNLSVGNQVAVQNQVDRRWTAYGVIVRVCPNRKYLIRLLSRRVVCRNRRHIRRRYPHVTPSDFPKADSGSETTVPSRSGTPTRHSL
ncbi:uncharacterized protein LOC122384401 [Amphibalanus amphitrite]|uniref:uncharacterized protein LOC122384401 n=1 Tax=Amphibalanus amphitrite TaxID=1232801 RepID=UPI001C8FECDD|nr:uncharacterized protein LOC122384401 [Amphibalanus amphitrite]